MGKKKRPLTEAEIWDDSALLSSWDDALAEYKLYHSIHARGERVEDVLRAVEEEGNSDGALFKEPVPAPVNGMASEALEDGELQEELEEIEENVTQAESHAISSQKAHEDSSTQPQASEQVIETDPIKNTSGIPGLPGAIIGGVENEGLKNLMMSWYYAGYYTGLYDGQQQVMQTSTQISKDMEGKEGN